MKRLVRRKSHWQRAIRTLKQQIDVTQRELEQLNNRQQDNKSCRGSSAIGGWQVSDEAELPAQSGQLVSGL